LFHRRRKSKKKKEEEPEFEELKNPARVTYKQKRYLSFDVDDRYTPVKRGEIFGIVLLRDNKPEQDEVFVTPSKPAIGGEPTAEDDVGDEPSAPEPFDYDPEKEN